MAIPVFEDGEVVTNPDVPGGQLTVKRTEKDEQGFFRIIYDTTDDEGEVVEAWCYAVDCAHIVPDEPEEPATDE